MLLLVDVWVVSPDLAEVLEWCCEHYCMFLEVYLPKNDITENMHTFNFTGYCQTFCISFILFFTAKQ